MLVSTAAAEARTGDTPDERPAAQSKVVKRSAAKRKQAKRMSQKASARISRRLATTTVLADGFEKGNLASWSATSGPVAVHKGAGRNGGYGLVTPNQATSAFVTKSFASSNTVTASFCYQRQSGGWQSLVKFPASNLAITDDGGGGLHVVQGASWSRLGSFTGTLRAWHCAKVVLDAAADTVTLDVDGKRIASLKKTISPETAVRLGDVDNTQVSGPYLFDDVTIATSAGAAVTPTPTPTPTPVSTPTPAPTPVSTPTPAPTPVSTPTPAPTPVATPTPTPTPVATPTPTPTPTTPSGGNPTGRFYVVGKDIIDPSGKKFFPVGGNIGINGQIGFNYNDSATGHANDAVAWGWNTVRLTVYCSNQTPWISSFGVSNVLREVDAFIAAYTAKKIAVMVECHDLTGKGRHGAIEADLDAFWTQMANRHKNNTYVWFNPANEPLWATSGDFVPLNLRYYNLVRNLGAENLFVADVMNMGQDAGWGGAKRLYDPSMGPALANGRCNVLFGMHAYGGIGGTDAHNAYFSAVHNANLALVVGEAGYTTNGTSTAGDYPSNVNGYQASIAAGRTHGVGVLAWHATHNDAYSLKNSRGPFWESGASGNLSPMGQAFWNLSQNKPNLGAFTGSYKASNCASAQ
jgi:hypothetical protein